MALFPKVLGKDGRAYVLADASLKGTPREWAIAAWALYDRFDADSFVVETNQGGDMIKHTLETVRPNAPVVEVRATRGKHIRAEPISALYASNMISHVGSILRLSRKCAR